MRIVAGKLGGRNFDAPKGHRTHPMSEKARGALFNALGDINGLSVLDAFGGSGAISFEAISQGAKKALIIESDSEACKVIEANLQQLGISSQIKLVGAYVRSWLNKNPDVLFDIVICDPPYNDLQEETLEKLALHTKNRGLAIFSLPPYADIRLDKNQFVELSRKDYGDATLAFYRKIA